MPGRSSLLLVAAALLLTGWALHGSVQTAETQAPELQPAPHPLAEAANKLTRPEGFHVELFAGEPDVRQPIACALDARGRLWVVECYTYPNWELEGKPANDRVVIFEDTDGDGRHDKRTIFWDKGANLSGLELGFGGVWLCATPNLLFIPDADGDDVPDAEPVIKLDGWDLKARHNVVNGLTWGPDGWLYGMNGILSNSKVGKPGTPEAERIVLNCGVWRYHPVSEAVEIVALGTTNPWGLDFDDYGEMFITNCVIPHLFHVVPGAHFIRMFGDDLNPHSYGLIESCADHIHWAGGKWTESRGGKGKHSEAGGGHAHVGAMIYLGGAWPAEYRESILICNVHGNRLNRDNLTRRGSGYVATHGPDFLRTNDEWFRGIEMLYGPDGGVFLLDWSDTGECHENDAHGAHHDSGRIYKITHGPRPATPTQVDLGKLRGIELADLQLHANDWYVRQARLQLQARNAKGGGEKAIARLKEHWASFANPDSKATIPQQLRVLWCLQTLNALSEAELHAGLANADEHVRAWSIRFLVESRQPSEKTLAEFTRLAESDPSPFVRLYLASALQRIPLAQRWPLATALVAHAGDAEDANIPLMLWYGIEPLIPSDKMKAITLTAKCKIPLVRTNIARRLATP